MSSTTDVGTKAPGGVLAAACVSALVVNANTSAVTILLPSISEDVGAPVAELQWAVTGYSLVGAAVIVTSGALGDVLGRRKVFLAGLALFIGSCVLIALSTSRRAGRTIRTPSRSATATDPTISSAPTAASTAHAVATPLLTADSGTNTSTTAISPELSAVG